MVSHVPTRTVRTLGKKEAGNQEALRNVSPEVYISVYASVPGCIVKERLVMLHQLNFLSYGRR